MGCRNKIERNKDRDVSEKIALGLPTGAPSQDSLFDQRLFNQSKVSVHLQVKYCRREYYVCALSLLSRNLFLCIPRR